MYLRIAWTDELHAKLSTSAIEYFLRLQLAFIWGLIITFSTHCLVLLTSKASLFFLIRSGWTWTVSVSCKRMCEQGSDPTIYRVMFCSQQNLVKMLCNRILNHQVITKKSYIFRPLTPIARPLPSPPKRALWSFCQNFLLLGSLVSASGWFTKE